MICRAGAEPFCLALLWHIRCFFLDVHLLKFGIGEPGNASTAA